MNQFNSVPLNPNNIIKWCKENGNPEPDFEYNGTSLVVTFKKVKIVEKEKREKIFFDLNDRQKKALEYIKEKGRITNKEYQNICKTDRVTAFRDLQGLVKKQIIAKIGTTGKWTYYKMKR